jgi:hypothetical protein
VGRTVDGFVGAIARKDPTVEIPAQLQPVVDDTTADGLNLAEFVKRLCNETILQGRGGVLVEYDEKLKRSKLCFYQAEAITNWDADGGVVLRELVYEPDPTDSFKQVEIEQYRQLALVDGVYTVTLWRKKQADAVTVDGSEWMIYDTPKMPSIRAKPLDAVPFFWLSPQGRAANVAKPPLMGLVNTCFAHYRKSADLAHGLHWTALPTFFVAGATQSTTPVAVGAMAALMLPDPNSKAGYAEFSGAGMTAIANALEAEEARMAVLGASVFHDGPKGVEAAETARIRTSGETSLLSGVVTTVEEVLQAALECAAKWMSITGKVKLTLNREWVDGALDGPTLTGLVQAFEAGALSLPQFLYNLQQADMLAPDTDLDEEAKRVAVEAAQRQDAAIKLAQAAKPVVKPGGA